MAELTTVGTTEAVFHHGVEADRLAGLTADTEYESHGVTFRTLPEPGELLSTFATVNDVHFGETVCGVVDGHPEVGPVCRSSPDDPPYPEMMNRGAAAEMAQIDPARVVVKGDLTSTGTPAEYQSFLDVYQGAFGARLLHVRGNHESFYDLAVADQPLQCVDLPGVRLVLLDTSRSQVEYGGLSLDQLEQLDDLASHSDRPVMVMGHHHPWNPGSAIRPDRYFGINPAASEQLVELIARRQSVVAYSAGHTHRNRVRKFTATGEVPFIEVGSVKDFPGGWAEYRVYDGGVLQIFHRVSNPEALAWTEQTRQMYHGLYANYSFGSLQERCFVIPFRKHG